MPYRLPRWSGYLRGSLRSSQVLLPVRKFPWLGSHWHRLPNHFGFPWVHGPCNRAWLPSGKLLVEGLEAFLHHPFDGAQGMVLRDQALRAEGIKESRRSGFLIGFLVGFACKFSGLILHQSRQECTYISDFFSNLSRALRLAVSSVSPVTIIIGAS